MPSATRSCLLAIASTLTLLATFAPPASASTGADITALRAELANGTLLDSHGLREMCLPGSGCQAVVVTSGKDSSTPLSTTSPVGLGADDLARAYHLPPARVGLPNTVAIIDAGAYPSLAPDLAVYRAQYHLPPCTTQNGCLKVTDIDGGPPPSASSDPFDREVEESAAVETSLDVDMVSAACPGCHISVLLGNDFIGSGNPTFDQKGAAYATAYQTAVKHGANTVSLSDMFGDTANLVGPIGRKFDHQGVPLFVSLGDVGGGGSAQVRTDDDPPTTEEAGWPQDLPWVVSVGGTLLKPTDASRTSFTETAWPGLVGSCANTLPKTDGQPASIAANCHGFRTGADISAIADPSSGPAVYDSYAPSTGKPANWMISGGTSASAPFVAAWYARGEVTGLAHGPSQLYAAQPWTFHDITSGGGPAGTCAKLGWAPALCQAGPGWDGPTGLGSPNGLHLF
ncbi:MAG TPA: hypothetical protein VG247_20990 [Pseudonocardiaceae bacterium]|jgi:subtilase family serine protease|nr:hypothetical protein [Pseudonocardiaceae bacterium]